MNDELPFNLDLARRLVASPRHQMQAHMQRQAVREIEASRDALAQQAARIAALERALDEIANESGEKWARMIARAALQSEEQTS